MNQYLLFQSYRETDGDSCIFSQVKSRTIFHGTHKPLRLWFQAMKLRRAMVRSGREKLSGVVEIDETYTGGSKHEKRGRGVEGKILVVIVVEDKDELGFGRIRTGSVKDASDDSLTKFVQDNLETGSTVRTNDWNGYNDLRKIGYAHVVQQALSW